MNIPHVGTAPSTESPLSICLVQDEIRFIITYFTKQNIFVATREIREGPKRKEWISIGILLGFLKQESRVIEPKESSWQIDTVWCHRSLIFLLVTKPSHDDRSVSYGIANCHLRKVPHPWNRVRNTTTWSSMAFWHPKYE
ncbi:hypothetical protein BDC45DRAFT_555903 [Circinella umbellata]|nr:hypothetical protein BDC45DRAFT_555903 [Circinella umbellata]